MVKVGLINNRHPMPVQNYIFEKEIEGKNELVCYITGLSSVTAALVQVCAVYGVELTLMHYDRDTDEYVPQVIFSKNRWRI